MLSLEPKTSSHIDSTGIAVLPPSGGARGGALLHHDLLSVLDHYALVVGTNLLTGEVVADGRLLALLNRRDASRRIIDGNNNRIDTPLNFFDLYGWI